MPGIEVDPSQVHSIEVDPSQVTAMQATPEKPGIVSRFFESAKMLNPIPAIQEWAFRPSPVSEAMGALGALQAGDKRAAAGGNKAPTPDEQTKIDAGMNARLSNPMGYDVPPQASPLLKAIGQTQQGNVAGAAGTLAFGYVAPALISKVASMATQKLTGGAEGLRKSAEANFEKALNPTTKVNKILTDRTIAPGLAERGVTATSIDDLRGQAQAQMEHYNGKIDAAFETAKDQNIRLGWEPIVQKLEDAKTAATIDGVIPEASKAYISKLSKLQDEVLSIADKNGGSIPAASMRQLRQINDSVVAKSKGGFALAPDELSMVEAHKVQADALRGVIADALPDAAAANKQFSFWKNVDDVAGATTTRRVGQRSPLTERMAQGAGAAVGGSVAGVHGAMVGASVGGRLSRLQNSMIWNSVSAAQKMKVAEMLNAGNEAGAWTLANKAALAAVSIDRTKQIEGP